jgi:hypothetical protein
MKISVDVFLNEEVITVNQDPLGVQGRRVDMNALVGGFGLVAERCGKEQNQQWMFNDTTKAIISLVDKR